jgi:NaMN:DMB phosphoribosyltransferase
MQTARLTPAQRESLQLLCRVIATEDSLRKWFGSLAKLPSNIRANAIMQITSQMRHADEEEEIIEAIGSLSNPEVYAVAAAALSGARD